MMNLWKNSPTKSTYLVQWYASWGDWSSIKGEFKTFKSAKNKVLKILASKGKFATHWRILENGEPFWELTQIKYDGVNR